MCLHACFRGFDQVRVCRAGPLVGREGRRLTEHLVFLGIFSNQTLLFDFLNLADPLCAGGLCGSGEDKPPLCIVPILFSVVPLHRVVPVVVVFTEFLLSDGCQRCKVTNTESIPLLTMVVKFGDFATFGFFEITHS